MNGTPAPHREPSSRARGLSRWPWGWIALAQLLVSQAIVNLVPDAVRNAPTLAGRVAYTASNALMLACAVPLVVGAVLWEIHNKRARAAASGPDRVTAVLREGASPYGVGFATFLVAVCPAGLLANAILGQVRNDSQHFTTTILLASVVVALTARFARPRRLEATEATLAYDAAGGRVVLPWRRVVALTPDPEFRVIRVRTRDGAAHAIACPALDAAALGELTRALRALHDAALRREAEGDVHDAARLAALDRNGRGLPAWREALRALAAGDEGYREVPVQREDLARVLRSARASAERRIAAALALRAARDPQAEAAIRAAIDDPDAPRPVRVALEQVLRDRLDERALERALEADRAQRAGE